MNPSTLISYVLLLLALLALPIILIYSTLITLLFIRISKAPAGIPWAGLKGRKHIPKLRACLGEWNSGRSVIDEGYEKYGRHGKAFVLPAATWCPVVLPPSHARWVANQPENVLSGNEALDQQLGLEYLAHGPDAAAARDFTILRRDLTRQLLNLTPAILEEIRTTLEEEFASNNEKEWKEVQLQKIIHTISFRTTNRIFVGLPLCRNKAYRKAVGHWAMAFGLSSLALRSLVPQPLKSLFMTLAAVPTKYLQRRAARYFAPIMQQRLQKTAADHPNDMLTWLLTSPNPLSLENISGKLILLNLFAEHTTAMVTGSLLFNLLSQPNASQILFTLHAEAATLLPQIENDARNIRLMHLTDSVTRETLRLYPTGAQTMMRVVVSPTGLTTPSGDFLPKGTYVHSLVDAPHRDPNLHGSDADKFLPFRHVGEGQKSVIQIDEEFLSFGLGKHACPGRFFAVHLMKLIVGVLVEGWELEMPKDRREQKLFDEIMDIRKPSEKVVVKVRRRGMGEKS